MKTFLRFFGAMALFAAAIPSTLQAQSNVVLTLKMSTNGLTGWQTVQTVVTNMPASPQAFYRMDIVLTNSAPPPTNSMALIPAGSFEMGDKVGLVVGGDGYSYELPVHTVNVSAFYVDKYEVTKALWDEVRAWGLTNGYTDLPVGAGKAANHPVNSITWYAMVKWCNARSKKENLTECYTVSGSVYKTGNSTPVLNMSASGYRLPTEAEWEKAARGGLSGKRFPWGDTINHSFANYHNGFYSYESPQGAGWHPSYYSEAGFPYSSPVGSFAPNGYGLYDMAGNVLEWCWDRYDSSYYGSSPASDPTGAPSGSFRVLRGGGWSPDVIRCRVAGRGGGDFDPGDGGSEVVGFRCVRR
jgi:formylglycine-generating enzyme